MRKAALSVITWMPLLMAIILVAVLLACVALTSCGKSDYTPPYDTTWLSPGKVEVGGYYPGGRAEWNVTIHNGNIDDITDAKMVTTEPVETKAAIPLKSRPYGDIKNIQLKSDIDELLKPVAYDIDKQELTIDGFKPDVSRRLDITYPCYTRFVIDCRAPDHPLEGYTSYPINNSWIVIADKNPELSPGETRDILIALDIPEGVNIDPAKWEFWISVMEGDSQLIATELCCRWLIDMKR